MNNGEKAIGSKSSKKQTLRALPVVNKLAAHGAVHTLRRFSQIINLQGRPVLAETVGENSISTLGAAEIDNFVSYRLDAAKTLDRHRISCVIFNLNFNRAEGSAVINL